MVSNFCVFQIFSCMSTPVAGLQAQSGSIFPSAVVFCMYQPRRCIHDIRGKNTDAPKREGLVPGGVGYQGPHLPPGGQQMGKRNCHAGHRKCAGSGRSVRSYHGLLIAGRLRQRRWHPGAPSPGGHRTPGTKPPGRLDRLCGLSVPGAVLDCFRHIDRQLRAAPSAGCHHTHFRHRRLRVWIALALCVTGHRSHRRKFYRISVWAFAWFPCQVLASVLLRSSCRYLPFLCGGVLYLIICASVTCRLRPKNHGNTGSSS